MPVVPAHARAPRLAALGRGVAGVLTVLGFLASAALILPGLLGYQRYVLVGGSMEPTIKQGSLVYDEVVPVGGLRRGDVITFVAPGHRSPTTHRIARVNTIRGTRVLRTKGDANASIDPWRMTLPGPTQARQVASVPYAGWLFIALGSPEARRWLLGLPALLIAASVLVRTWRYAGRLVAESEAGAGVRG